MSDKSFLCSNVIGKIYSDNSSGCKKKNKNFVAGSAMPRGSERVKAACSYDYDHYYYYNFSFFCPVVAQTLSARAGKRVVLHDCLES